MGESTKHITRRGVLAGALSSVAATAFAAPPTRSLVPRPRPADWALQSVPSAESLLNGANLTGKTAFAVLDARSGEVLEARTPLLAQPPASVAKAITSLYGLEKLGAGFRFRTQLVATGPVRNGRLEGDLLLVGGGDPHLDTDGLAQMAAELKATGIREVTGEFRVADGVLPQIPEIDPTQPDHLGYNPSISGLNLNFNRVYFEWKRDQNDYSVTLDARSERVRPRVRIARMSIVDRDQPVYDYARRDDVDIWTVARSALGNGGGRWLPVRAPGAYVSEVFQILARSHGIVLRPGRPARSAITGTVLVEVSSAELADILRSMLRFSTNLTAEVVGLTASVSQGTQIRKLSDSGAAMSQWVEQTLGASRATFVDHSGLSDNSRISASDMAKELSRAGAEAILRPLLKKVELSDDQGTPISNHPMQVSAKTGTLNFVSSLAGYATTKSGRDLVFAIFSADMPRRNALPEAERERPRGGRAWTGRARGLQNDLLRRWGLVYDQS